MREAAEQIRYPKSRPQRAVKSIIAACRDPHFWAPWFHQHGHPGLDSYAAWFAFLAALFALPMTDAELTLYRKHTGRTDRPSEPAREAWMVVGRRGGKSRFMAIIAVYLACFRSYVPFLAPGERATVAVIAADRRQARVVLRYIRALLDVPVLRDHIERETAEVLRPRRQRHDRSRHSVVQGDPWLHVCRGDL